MSFLDQVDQAIPSKTTPVVVYGRNRDFGAAERAFEFLTSAGYSDVRVYEDGIEGWREAGNDVAGTLVTHEERLPDGRYELDDDDSYLQWEGSNIVNRHYGTVGLSQGEIRIIDARVVAGSLTADMTDLHSEDLQGAPEHDVLTGHLKSGDFFLVDEHPEARLEITSAIRIPDAVASEPNFDAVGTLTLRGVTKPIDWQMIVGTVQDHIVAQGRLSIDRTRWGATYGSGKFFEWLGMHLVNDLIDLRFKATMRPVTED